MKAAVKKCFFRTLLRLFTAMMLYFFVWISSAYGASDAKKPNMIFILADDLGYGDLSCYGQTKFQTPHIDRMAAEGLRFTQFYAGSTVCAPSRCCLLTGLHTGHSQIRGNLGMKPEGQYPLAEDTFTVADLFEEAGYTTGAFGKWGLGSPGSSGTPEKQGFGRFFGYNCQSLAHFYYPDHLWRNEEKVLLPGNDPQKQTGQYSHDLIVKEALDFIRANKDGPFFLYVPFTIPHAELTVPADSMQKYRGKYPETPFVNESGHGYGSQPYPHAAFAAMVDRMDGDVGRILTLLRELNLDETTCVMFTSDNGPHHEGGGDPDFFDSYGPLRGCKRDLYEGGVRVPLIVRWPGKVRAGRESDYIGAFWDFLPTCSELTGVPVPRNIDGISFLPVLLGQEKAHKEHSFLYWELHEEGGKQAVRMGRWKGVRLNVDENPDGPIELYDLDTDLGETTDAADQHAEIVQKIAQIMKAEHSKNEPFPFLYEQSQSKPDAAADQ